MDVRWLAHRPKARCLGEHLECSPCGDGGQSALARRFTVLPGPEVLLSLLPT